LSAPDENSGAGDKSGGIAGTLEVVKDTHALAARAAEIIAGRLRVARYPFRVALSGGSTPRALYQRLAQMKLDWDCAELFFGDERFVPPDHKDSNYRMVRESLLATGLVQPRKLLAIPTDGTPQSAADRYDEILRQQYGAGTLEAGIPLFHLTLLGLGDDGHTASLLPGQPVLEERQRWAAAVPDGRGEPRITLTYPALDSSELILFLVSGAEKRDALAQVRGGALPAGGIKPQGRVLWLVDEAAAGEEDQGYGF
jgi:6-phosphogluconolactonase